MKRNATDVIITLVLILFVIIYAGYQLFTFLYSPYETETAFTYTVADSFSTSGRSEVMRRNIRIAIPPGTVSG